MDLNSYFHKSYKERNAKIRELFNRNGIEYTEMGDYNPICFVINWGNKNKNNQPVTNSDNIVMYFCAYNFTYTYRITKIYDTKGKDQADILKTINNLNLFDIVGEKYYIDEDGYVGMKLTIHDDSEQYAIDLLLSYKGYFFDMDFVNLIFKWKE